MSQQLVMDGLNGLALPGGSGSSAVTSVNGFTGAVVLAAADVGAVPTSRTVTAGTGLTGGGNLTADRSFAVSYGTAAGTATQGNDTRVVNAVQTTDYTTPADVASLNGGAGVTQGTPHLQQRNEPGTITRVWGQLALASGTYAAGTTLATLNAGGRPADPAKWLIRTIGSNTQTLLNFGTDGTIKNQSSIVATGDTINIDGFTFIHA